MKKKKDKTFNILRSTARGELGEMYIIHYSATTDLLMKL